MRGGQGPGRRQLRLVRLQPGPVPRPAGRRAGGAPQRRPRALDEVAAWASAASVISPGPGGPRRPASACRWSKTFAGRVPMLGVCLGHQAIGYAFGASVVRAANCCTARLRRSPTTGEGVFAGLPNPLTATRYHSLVVERELPWRDLEVSAWAEDGTVMGIRHRPGGRGGAVPPESVLTDGGHRLLANWLAACGLPRGAGRPAPAGADRRLPSSRSPPLSPGRRGRVRSAPLGCVGLARWPGVNWHPKPQIGTQCGPARCDRSGPPHVVVVDAFQPSRRAVVDRCSRAWSVVAPRAVGRRGRRRGVE